MVFFELFSRRSFLGSRVFALGLLRLELGLPSNRPELGLSADIGDRPGTCWHLGAASPALVRCSAQFERSSEGLWPPGWS